MSDVDRHEIARRVGLPPILGDRLRGETAEEVEADARAFVAVVERERPQELTEGERLRNYIVLGSPGKLESDRALLSSLGIDTASQEPTEPAEPSFDGGTRAPAPVPSNPEAEHNALLGDWLGAKRAESPSGSDW